MRCFIVKFWSIFSKRDRFHIVFLLLIIVCGAVLEVVGIGAVLPFIRMISNPSTVRSSAALRYLYDLSGASSTKNFIIIMGLALIALFMLKNAILFGFQFIQCRFVFHKGVYFSHRLFQNYLSSAYTFHLQRNSAELMRNVSNEVGVFILYLLRPVLQLLTDITIASAIFMFTLYIDLFSSLIMLSVLGISILAFYLTINKRISYFGKIRQYHVGKINQQIMQGLGGIKEAKVLGREPFFVEAYHKHIMENARAGLFHSVLQQFPHFFIETLAVTSIMIVMISLLLKGNDSQSIFTTISLFALAAYRLIPSVNRITSSIATIRYGAPSLNVIYNDMKHICDIRKEDKTSSASTNEKLTFQDRIELCDVKYKYAGTNEFVLNGISFVIKRGASVGIVGSTGAGKTTLIDLILGLLPPTEGEILADGYNIQDNLSAWQRQIGYVPQSIYLADDTIRSNIAFGVEPKRIDEQKILQAIRLAKLEDYVTQLPEGLDTVVGERGIRMSGGQRQRIGIARALYNDPVLLVLDEATASIDNETEAAVIESVQTISSEKTIIMIAHRLTTVQNCDTIYFMKDGRIVDCGTYDGLLESNEQFRRMVKVGA